MKRLRLYLNRILIGIKATQLYRNWQKVILLYLGIGNLEEIAVLRRNAGKYFIRKGSQDIRVISDIYMNRPYHKFLPILKEGSVVIDIGANIGAFSVLSARQNAGVKVYSYEPFGSNFKQLQKNILLNRLSSISAFPLGVGAKKETRNLFIDKENTGGHTLYGTGQGVSIKVITLADVFKDNNIKECDFLKLDCEGAEFEILYSTPDNIFGKIKTITLEFHENEKNKGKDLNNFLQKKGFHTTMVGNDLGFIYGWRKK